MEKILIIVDMQKDFVDGSLGTKEAQAIVPAVKEKIENFNGDIIFTKDTHGEDYMNTQEGQNLPVPHCIKGTPGHEIINELQPYVKKALPVFSIYLYIIAVRAFKYHLYNTLLRNGCL